MAVGSAFGGTCYSTQAEAAAMWCSGVAAGTSTGLMTCASVDSTTVDPVVGGAANFKWTLRHVGSTGTITQSTVTGQKLVACETYDYEFWSPYLAAFVSAAVVVLCARWLVDFWRPNSGLEP